MYCIWSYIISVHILMVLMYVFCLIACLIVHACCFNDSLFQNSWAVNVSKHNLSRQTFCYCFITPLTNSCTFGTWQTFLSSFGFWFRNRGLRVRGVLSIIRPTNVANTSQVKNVHYITWLHPNYKKTKDEIKFQMHYNICRLQYQYSPFPLRVPGMGNARLINCIEPPLL